MSTIKMSLNKTRYVVSCLWQWRPLDGSSREPTQAHGTQVRSWLNLGRRHAWASAAISGIGLSKSARNTGWKASRPNQTEKIATANSASREPTCPSSWPFSRIETACLTSKDRDSVPDAGSKIAHETTDALTLPCHARTSSGCKSGDIERTLKKGEEVKKKVGKKCLGCHSSR